MASSTKKHKEFIKICSFNLHGLNNGASMLTELCNSHDIILLQEHWLLKQDLCKLDFIHPDFKSYGLSGMNVKADNNILIGRPFGGVAILWNKKLSNSICIIDSDEQDGRYLSVKIHITKGVDIILTCVYFPCLKSKADYVISAGAIIGHIESIIKNYPLAEHIIAGDFNFPCTTGNVGYDIITKLLYHF